MLYLNQALRQTIETGVLSAETNSIVLKYRKPDGIVYEKEVILADPSGIYYAYWEVDELDQLGNWTFWVYIVTVDDRGFPGNPWTEEVVVEGQAIVTRDFVKSYLGITDDTYDFKIDGLIPLVEADYLRIRNIPWDLDVQGNIIYPSGSNITCAQMIGYKLTQGNFSKDYGKPVSSISLDNYSVSYDLEKLSFGYPKDITSSIITYIYGR